MESKAKYGYLLEDPSFRRWFDNLRRGSDATAYEWWRRMGQIHSKFGLNPQQIAQMRPKEAYGFILDMVSAMERDGKSFYHIDGCIKALKNWLDFNDIQVTQKVRLSKFNRLSKVGDERPPTQDELRQILDAANPRARAACALVAMSGLRIEVLGNYLGGDGLRMQDLPELAIDNESKTAQFEKVPALLVVRGALSKARHQYFTFVPEEACVQLRQYFEWRMRREERLLPSSAVVTPKQIGIGGHMRTTNVGAKMRVPIRAAGFRWRPYALRRYFDTRMMLAESEGIIIKDFRVFWMGHKGDIEHTYTVNKRLQEDIIERMRLAFGKASSKYLQTQSIAQASERAIISTFNMQILKTFGYTEEEIAKIPEAGDISPERIQELIKAKSMQMLGLNGNTQRVVSMEAVEEMILQGWEFVKDLPSNKAIVRLPK